MSEDSEDPKIFVDEDWKERVRAEREAARAAGKVQDQASEGDATAASSHAEAPTVDSFTMLVSMLATQAMVALGKIADPVQGHAVVRPSHAKQSIDMLDMLEQKTKGNLAPDEAQMLTDLLHELRMLYVSVYRQPQESSKADESEAGPKPE